MSDLKIEKTKVSEYHVINKDHFIITFTNGESKGFFIKKNATPKEFIKHLRSMIWAIQKKVIENEND